MSLTPLLLLDRAHRYRDQADRARELARCVPTQQVAYGLVALAHKLQRKALRLERISAGLAVRQQQDANGPLARSTPAAAPN
jgi:hypothetical protein